MSDQLITITKISYKRIKMQEKIDRIKKIISEADAIIITAGAGLAVPTIRNFGEKFVKRSKKATLIRINPRDNYISQYFGISLKCGALDGLRQILC